MSRPISIATAYNSDPVASPMESLGRSFGAQQIVDSICGSPIQNVSRHAPIGQPPARPLPETPDFHLSNYISQGGKFLGQTQTTPLFSGLSTTCGTTGSLLPSQQPPCTCNAHGAAGLGGTASLMSQFAGLSLNNLNNNYLGANLNEAALYAQRTQLLAQQHAIEAILFTARLKNLGDPLLQPIPPNSRLPAQSQSSSYSSTTTRDSSPSDDLLTRYRANPSMMKGLKLSDVRGVLLSFAKDQVGSRLIQQKLEYSDISEKDAIFDEVLENTHELVDDIFGNYVVQKFFEYGEERHWNRLVEAMLDKVHVYAFQMYACRVLQKALEKISEPLQLKILKRIRPVTARCMKDQNGNHVIQKAIEKVHPVHVQFIVDALLETSNTIYEMSVDPYGCRVVQRCLEHCTPEQTRPMIAQIHGRFYEVTNNQYGNYVVQHVIQHGTDEDRQQIVERVSLNLLEYSTHKYSSNVIEKCLTRGTNEHRGMLVKAACYSPDGSVPIVVQMMKDQYANYVVQKMFDQVSNDQRRELILTVRPHIPVLRQYPHGKHILAKLDKYFQKQVAVSLPYPEM